MTGWIVAGALLERPVPATEAYPCLCEQPDPDPPAWKAERAQRSGDPIVYLCDPYLARKGRHVGTWQNRCPCWGMPRIDDRTGTPRPGGCCVWSEHNPAYAATVMRGIDWRRRYGEQPGDRHGKGPHGTLSSPGHTDGHTDGPAGPNRGTHPSQPHRPGQPDGQDPHRCPAAVTPPGQHVGATPLLSPPGGQFVHTAPIGVSPSGGSGGGGGGYDDEWDFTLDPGPDEQTTLYTPGPRTSPGPARPLTPYVRRWPPEQITCPCPTPWDHLTDARQFGHHCPNCHQNFKSERVAAAHQRSIMGPCKDPSRQTTVDGLPVYRATYAGAHIVWH